MAGLGVGQAGCRLGKPTGLALKGRCDRIGLRRRNGAAAAGFPANRKGRIFSMSTKDINSETGLTGAAVDRAVEPGGGKRDSVATSGRQVAGLIDWATQGMNLGTLIGIVAGDGDVSQLADLCLVHSYSAFARGDSESGCRKLWEAVEFALSVAADKRGWPCQTEDDHFDILEQLQAETGKYEDPDIVSGYLVACNYRENTKYGFMEDYEIQGGLPVVRDFVGELLSSA